MTKGFDPKIWDSVVNGSPALRYHILEKEPLYFAVYYFPEYFKFKIPDFHYDMYEDAKDLSIGEINELMWCVFRDGAKTSLGKIAIVIWFICYKKKNFIGWDSNDGDNSGAALYDITIALQTNKKLISDFGHLYYKKKAKDALLEAKMKRINSFITENGVKVVTFSTQQPIRGQVQGSERLDCMVFDDFENNNTKDSPVVTNKIIGHIDEFRAGMPAGACAIYLCNYITDTGSVAHIMEKLRDIEDKGGPARVRFVAGVGSNGIPAWSDKHVMTEKEAIALNKKIPDTKLHKTSIEALRLKLGEQVFQTEFMLNPSQSGDLFFDREKVEGAMKRAKEPKEINANLKVWAKFNPRHRYGGGADTAEGIGGDHNASVWIDFTQKPAAQIVATFQDNELSNTQFGWELKRQGALYGFPVLIPEINNTGYGTIAELQTAEYPNIYMREQKDQTTGKIKKAYGWKATIGTVYEVMSAYKDAFESGELEILDLDLLKEMYLFTKSYARTMGSGRQKGVTRHFDKLRAAALAWEGRRWSEVSESSQGSYQQPAYEGASEFEGQSEAQGSHNSPGNDDLPPWLHEVT